MKRVILVVIAGFTVPGVLGTAKESEEFYPIHLHGHRYDREGTCDVRYEVPGDYAITGVGLRASDGHISTMRITIREILPDGTLGELRVIARGAEPKHNCEGYIELPDGYVAVGFGVRVDPFWDVNVLSLWGAKFHRDGTLGDPIEIRSGLSAKEMTERQILLRGDRLLTGIGVGTENHDVTSIMAQSATASRYPPPEEPRPGDIHLTDYRLEPYDYVDLVWFLPRGRVITGMSMRARDGSLVTLVIHTRDVMPDGSLGNPRTELHGWYSNYEPEGREAHLPEGYVATGVGLTIRPVADVGDFVLYGAKLNSDGTLSDPVEVHGGFGPNEEEQQREIRFEGNRALTGLGFLVSNDSVIGMLGESAKVEKK
jgi:hypothetical protein